ncbi:DUF397 domain-containing protein [Nocardia carnea]|uniref:DUF397 domain-containing protein n=1 Tax=Nocardia carnea TaxID=37328 RepID=UPI002453F15D|nr:DUF397 domain-containing protein [Nocardia carnea]
MTSGTAPIRWFKSSYSDSTGECVEVAWLDDATIGVRDSKDSTGPALAFAPNEWAAFTTSLRRRPS